MKKNAIILLSSERSGSNLLRTLLGNHANISAPVAPHLIKIFYPIRHYYMDLFHESNNLMLFNDMIQVVNHPFSNWKLKLEYNFEEIKSLGVTSIIRMMDYIYKKQAEQNQKEYYFSKGINTFRYINDIKENISGVQFIHLVRDPRDVVASCMKREGFSKSSYDALLHWKKQQKLFFTAKQQGLKCISIKYEDLILDTEKVVNSILSELELPFDSNCYETSSQNKESSRSPYWKNLSQPIMNNNTNKFTKNLSEEDVLMIETIAKSEMKEYNYSAITNQDWKLNKSNVNFINNQRKEIALNSDTSISENMKTISSKKDLVNEITKRARIKYLSSVSCITRFKSFIKFNFYSIIKRNLLRYLGDYRMILYIRNYINR